MKYKNKLQTMLSISGCDFIFDPGEVKEFKEDSPYLKFLRNCPDLEEVLEVESEIQPEVSSQAAEEAGDYKSPDEPTNTPASASVPSLFTCEVCGKSFGMRVALAGHTRSHSPKK